MYAPSPHYIRSHPPLDPHLSESVHTPRNTTSPSSPVPPEQNPFHIKKLQTQKGAPESYPSPLESVHWQSDENVLLFRPFVTKNTEESIHEKLYLERAGPRRNLHFNYETTSAGIVVCGGLCPGINNVIRALVNTLHFRYKIKNIIGFKFGYQGLTPDTKFPPIKLTPKETGDIHHFGGSYLGTSRGPQDPEVMVETLRKHEINVMFCIGGDGTLKGAHALSKVIENRGYDISVIGIPKTIDNDIAFVEKTFGFETAVDMAQNPIRAAHEEARAAENGIGIVKLMGRESGFIALWASLASSDVNLLLIPEKAFKLDMILRLLEERLPERNHCVIVVSEGAGQDIFTEAIGGATDASGNAKFGDVGKWLSTEIGNHFKKTKSMPVTIKYIDPSYTIRSARANATDSVFAVSLAHAAAHAGMSGKTDMLVGLVHNEFVHIPITKGTECRKKVDVNGSLYQSLLDNTGMPINMTEY